MKGLYAAVVALFIIGCGEKPQQQPQKRPTQKQPLTPPKTEQIEKAQKTALGALKKGIAFLVNAQDKKKGFFFAPDCGITLLSALAIVTSPLKEKYKENIQKAVDFGLGFLKNDGSVRDERGYVIYKTSLLLSVLCRFDREKYAEQIKAIKNYLLKAQYWDPKVAEDWKNGGWGYDDKRNRERADLSNTVFAAEALRDAGVPKENPVWKRLQLFLTRTQNRTESNNFKVKIKEGKYANKTWKPGNDGGFVYGPGMTRSDAPPIQNPDGTITYPSYGSMTYAGLLTMVYAFLSKNDGRVIAAWNWCQKNWTLEENPGISERKYAGAGNKGLYYYYMTLAKALYWFGEPYIVTPDGKKHNWAIELIERLSALQNKAGFWKNTNPKWFEDQPPIATSYAIQALSYAYKFLEKLAKK